MYSSQIKPFCIIVFFNIFLYNSYLNKTRNHIKKNISRKLIVYWVIRVVYFFPPESPLGRGGGHERGFIFVDIVEVCST